MSSPAFVRVAVALLQFHLIPAVATIRLPLPCATSRTAIAERLLDGVEIGCGETPPLPSVHVLELLRRLVGIQLVPPRSWANVPAVAFQMPDLLISPGPLDVSSDNR